MVEVITTGLCHKFKVLKPGHYDCLESFYAVNVEKLPHKFPPLLHVAKLKFEPGERFQLSYKILNPNGKEIYNITSGEINMTQLPTPKTGGFFFVLEGITITEVGIHTVALFKDGIQFADTLFEIGIKNDSSQVKAINKTKYS